MTCLYCLLLWSASPVAAEPVVHRDLAYAQPRQERQTLDLYAPAEGSGHPVVVWIHGGGWRAGSKERVQDKPAAFVARGLVFVAINYRFFPQVSVKEMTGDVARAIHWVHDHAAEYGGDPETILVMGHSAGAHLAALVATDESYLAAEGLKLSLLKGCVPVDTAVYDAARQISSLAADQLARALVYRQPFGNSQKQQRDLSPVTHVARDKSIPPFLILHVADRADSSEQSKLFGQALSDQGISATVFAATGKNHGTINSELGHAGDPPTEALWKFLDQQLSGKK